MLLLLAGLLPACATPAPSQPPRGPRPQISSPAVLCRDASLGPGDFCMAVERLEALLGRGKGEILYYEITESGTSRPAVLYLGYAQTGGERIVIRDGMLVSVPPGPPPSEDESVRVGDAIIQFGLTRVEIDAMESRVRKLPERVDAGEVDLY